jgi:hypothetical protein
MRVLLLVAMTLAVGVLPACKARGTTSPEPQARRSRKQSSRRSSMPPSDLRSPGPSSSPMISRRSGGWCSPSVRWI